jgi:uncharacterized coiled-coil protein SlyX
MSDNRTMQAAGRAGDLDRRVAELESEIARQSALIATLDLDGHVEEAGQARDQLSAMLRRLERIQASEPLDERSLEAVMRDCPL